MTQLIRALSEQVAPVTPSPPAVSFERAAADGAPARPAQPPVEITTPAAKREPPSQPQIDALKAAAEQIESYLKASGRKLQFSVDETTGDTVITVRDTSGQIVRQIPNAEALRIAQSLGSQTNVLVDISI